MDRLADTNLLVRSVQSSHPMHEEALRAIKTLVLAGDRVCILPQTVAEFWNVCTRPASSNGLGLSVEATARHVDRLESVLALLPDLPEIYAEWKRLIVQHAVSGVKVYDARLVAAMQVHHIRSIVTFNVADFRRYSGIEVLHPQNLTGR